MKNHSSNTKPQLYGDALQFFLEVNPEYIGLLSHTKSSKYSSIPQNSIYKFPVLPGSVPSTTLDPKDCLHPSSVSITRSLQQIQDKSAFGRSHNSEVSSPSIHLTPLNGLAPKNSMNLNSFNSQSFLSVGTPFNLAEEMEKNNLSMQSSYISSALNSSNCPEKANISLTTKEMILDIHRKFTAMQDDFHLNSITPASELSLENSQLLHSELESSMFEGKKFCSLEKEEVSDFEENYPAYFKRTEESMRRSNIFVELVPEYQDLQVSEEEINLSRKGSKCTEEDGLSSPDDEGPLQISTARLFLNGETASKAKLSGPVAKFRIIRQLSNKILMESSSQILTTSPETQPGIEFPDVCSLISKKIVVFEQRGTDSAMIKTAAACSGYGASLVIEYSENEVSNKAFPLLNEKKNLWRDLWDLEVTNEICSVQVEWISCGYEHMAAVTSEGKVLTWGYGGAGCLGHGTLSSARSPTMVNSIFEYRIVYIECGGYHTVCTSEEGEVFAWGRNDVNQLGVPLTKLTKDEMGHVALRPIKLKELSKSGVCIKGVACGEAHTLLLDSEGKIYSFGWDEDGQLGYEDTPGGPLIRTIESMPYKAVKIAAGSVFSACVTDLGQVFVWGNGEFGQLGIGNTFISATFPSLVSGLRHEFVVDLVCGENNVMCISQSGAVYGWGKGITGKFINNEGYAQGSDIICFVPRLIPHVQTVQKYLVNKNKEQFDFADELRKKLMKLQR